MTAALLTVDTELSLAAYQKGVDTLDNFANAILGRVGDGEWGIGFQTKLLNAHGLKAVFFVEALCAGVVGLDAVKRTIEPILSTGHTVQLHLHTEWLRWAQRDPVDGHRGRCMADFSLEHQRRLIELGLETLIAAGAPEPVAFRAGNYGANNDTLRALAKLGIAYDSSYNFPYIGDPCRISPDQALLGPTRLDGVIEVPITCFDDYPGHQRGAQICAISAAEMEFVLAQSARQQRPTVVLVSHSFELLNRNRDRADRILVRRFERLCELLSRNASQTKTADFADLDPVALVADAPNTAPLRSNIVRTGLRMMQQAASTTLYG
jgi:hypothetical protein